MKKIVTLVLFALAFSFGQEAKIDSVAIMAKMVEIKANTKLIVDTANEQIGQLNFAYSVLEDMLVPKVEEIVEETEK